MREQCLLCCSLQHQGLLCISARKQINMQHILRVYNFYHETAGNGHSLFSSIHISEYSTFIVKFECILFISLKSLYRAATQGKNSVAKMLSLNKCTKHLLCCALFYQTDCCLLLPLDGTGNLVIIPRGRRVGIVV